MIEFDARLKKWGRSFGIVVPMDKVKEFNIKENESVKIKMNKEKNVLKETFGTMKFKKSTQELLDESDREAWDE